MTALELYLRCEGGERMRQRLASCLQLQLHDEPCAYWSSALLPAVDAIAQALYPCIAFARLESKLIEILILTIFLVAKCVFY